MTTIDRSKVNRALAKAIAHKSAGNDELAAQWAAHLVWLLDSADILADDGGAFQEPAR